MATPIYLLLLLLLLMSHNPTPTLAYPPAPPVTCNSTGCILSNAYGVWGDRKDCWVPRVVYPTTEEELRSAVADASRLGLKAKPVSGFAHNIPKLACPSPSSRAILISTASYTSTIDIDPNSLTVTADSGVGLRSLIDKVESAGLSLPASPYWEGVSIGGAVSTGAHGSSWWRKGGSLHDHVVSISLVVPAGKSDGYAKVVRFGPKDPLFDAARVSLGLLGIISKVTLSLEPGFKRSIMYSFEEDAVIEDRYTDHARQHEFADITWYPSQHTAVYRLDDRVPISAPGDGVNDFLGFQSTAVLASTAVRATEKLFEKLRSVDGKCRTAAAELGYKKLVANGLKNNHLFFTGYPVIGRQGKMQTSGSCLYSGNAFSMCAWDPRIKGLFFYESTAIFPAGKFGDFIRDVKRLRDLEPENFCGVDLYNGLFIRFIKGSSVYLGQSEDSVVVDFNYYRADDPLTPRLNEDVWEEVEQMAFFKYGAKPHWGKNRKVAFLGVQKKYQSMSKFAAAMKQLDPQGMFYSPWSDEILRWEIGRKDDGCALEGQCICSEDQHCSPGNGYFCRPGLVYQEAKVCRYSASSMV